MKTNLTCAIWLLSTVALAAPQVSNVVMTQDASSGLVTVKYDLASESAIVTLDILVGGASIGAEKLVRVEGDVNRLVTVGTGKRIAWHPDAEWSGAAVGAVARVKAWTQVDPPDYLVVNLAMDGEAVRYYETAAQVPGGIAAIAYKTNKLLMRRIHARGVTWQIGSETGLRDKDREKRFDVTLTNDFYMAVYEFTQGQYYFLKGARPTSTHGGDLADWKWATYPIEACYTIDLRGNVKDGYNWPDNGHAVNGTSLLGCLRSRTGLTGFDLPLETQWEFAARAGDYTHDLYNGYNLSSESGDANLDKIAWYPGNCKDESGNATTHPVGLKEPNAYGLYDMLGNVWETCRDRFQWKTDYPEANYDPNIGSVSQLGENRNLRGGSACTAYGAKTCRVCYRECVAQSSNRADAGFRPIVTLYP